ncbi:MAG: FAD synthetase family protein [Treponema sp.]|nr:FAD synthetase family protein [Treponema sp.]
MTVLTWNDVVSAAVPLFPQGTALSVGSFDGPHRGHCALFDAVFSVAEKESFVPGLVTFTKALPGIKHPVSYAGDIATLSERLNQYKNKGFDFVVLIDFDDSFARMSGEDFFTVLKNNLSMRFIAEGQDFRCGYKGSYGMTEITDFIFKNGIQAQFLDLVQADGKRISSSEVRKQIQKGNFSLVNELLERRFLLEIPETSYLIEKKSFLVKRSLLRQVSPETGIYKVLLNDSVPAELTASSDKLMISVQEKNAQSDFTTAGHLKYVVFLGK